MSTWCTLGSNCYYMSFMPVLGFADVTDLIHNMCDAKKIALISKVEIHCVQQFYTISGAQLSVKVHCEP